MITRWLWFYGLSRCVTRYCRICQGHISFHEETFHFKSLCLPNINSLFMKNRALTVELFVSVFLMMYWQKQCCKLCPYLRLCESRYISVGYMLIVSTIVLKVIVTDSFWFYKHLATKSKVICVQGLSLQTDWIWIKNNLCFRVLFILWRYHHALV